MGSVAKSVSSAGIEFGSLLGLQQLLAPTAISALPASLTTPIPAGATNGMHLLIRVFNHTTTGTITVTGTAPFSGAVATETTTTFAVPEVMTEYVDYMTTTTTGIFASVGASGVTIGTGTLTNGTIVIYGVQRSTRMIIGETKIVDKQSNVSPSIQHGLFTKDKYNIRTTQDPEWEFSGPLYANGMLLWLLAGFSSNLAYTTVPASPTSLLASTSVSGSGSVSLSTPPTAPAMILLVTLGGTVPATAGTVTITGTNIYGETITEVVVPATKTQQIYYSKNAFATVAASGVAFTAFGTGATITIGGIFCASVTTSTPATDSMNSFVLENYDSTSSKIVCGCVAEDFSFEGGLNKEAKVTAKGKGQGVYKVGDLTNSANQVFAPPQEPEEALTGWETLVFIDNASGTIGSTLQPDVINYKVDMKPMWKTLHKSIFNPPYRVYGAAYLHYREAEIALDFDMTQSTYNTEWVAFSQQRKRLIQIWVRGTPGYGVSGGTAYYPGFKFNAIGYWIDVPTVDWANGKESVQIQLKMKLFYDNANAYAWNFIEFTQLAGGWT